MKKLFLLLLGVMMSLPAFSFPFTYEGQTLEYQIFSDSTCGVVYNENNRNISGEVIIPTNVTYGGKKYAVTEIGGGAFVQLRGLTSVKMGEYVTTIGRDAFFECSGLTSVAIGESVTTIGMEAFYGCSALTSITLGESVSSIGRYAFYKCSALTSVNISSMENWLKIEFDDFDSNPVFYAHKLLLNGEIVRRLTIPEGIHRINPCAFYGCESLLTVSFPQSIESIGERAFYGCKSLTTVTFPESIESIESGTFIDCSSLQKAIFPSIKSYLGINYKNEYSLITTGNDCKIYIGSEEYVCPEELTWPSSLTRIPDYAFYGNQKLQRIILPETVTEIGKGAFGSSSLSEIIIPDGVTTIGGFAFEYCSNLRALTLGNSLTTIGDVAFNGCQYLTSVNIPSSVTSIGRSAFNNCWGLKSVKISDIYKLIQIEFGDKFSNPIYCAKSFTIGDNDEPLKHLDLDLKGGSISPFAFNFAMNLETVRVKGGSIGHDAFSRCYNIKQICLEADELGSKSFDYNDNLEALYCMKEVPPIAPDNSFSKYDGVKLYVPAGSVSRYENAETCWWKFLDIYESDFSDLDAIFAPDQSGVNEVLADGADYTDAPVEVYNLNGVKVRDSTEGLQSGFYIVRQGNEVKKIAVK